MTPHPCTRLLLAAALAALALPAAAAGKVYQWKDANGVTHYSDEPPPRGAYRDREISSRDPATIAPVAEPAAVPAANADVCTQARLNLQRLQSGDPVGLDADGDGQPDAPLTDAERAEQVNLAQRAIAARCPDAAAPPTAP
jgi:hypothetical protein